MPYICKITSETYNRGSEKYRLTSVVLTLTLSVTAPRILQILLLPHNLAQLWLTTDFIIIQEILNLIKMQQHTRKLRKLLETHAN